MLISKCIFTHPVLNAEIKLRCKAQWCIASPRVQPALHLEAPAHALRKGLKAGVQAKSACSVVL